LTDSIVRVRFCRIHQEAPFRDARDFRMASKISGLKDRSASGNEKRIIQAPADINLIADPLFKPPLPPPSVSWASWERSSEGKSCRNSKAAKKFHNKYNSRAKKTTRTLHLKQRKQKRK
jgi:hypothetical protein